MDFLLSYEITRKEPMSFADLWQKMFFDAEQESDSESAVLVAPRRRNHHGELGEADIINAIDMNASARRSLSFFLFYPVHKTPCRARKIAILPQVKTLVSRPETRVP